jgi:ketosteroid isomerase-like protein
MTIAPMVGMILVVAACSSSDDPVSPASTAPPQAPTTTTATTAVPTTSGNAQSLTVDEALAVSGDYIDAFNSGDADAVLALFTDDVALSEKYSALSDFGNGDPFEAMDRAFFEQELAWNTAQGTTFVSPECAVTEDGAAAAVTVSCEVGSLPAAEKAVDAPPVPTVITMVVTPDGISQLASEYVPEFGLARFDNWLFLNHKDDSQGVEYGDWNSVAEAQQGGTLRAQYVAEWAASLEANS